MNVPITIIGGGVVGLAVAYTVGCDAYLLEKNQSVGLEQSSRSSGVIHTGILNEPNTLKFKLNTEGYPQLYEHCARHGVPSDKVGKYIVASNSEDEATLEELAGRAAQCGMPVEMVCPKGLGLKAQSALYCMDTGVIDAGAYVRSLESLVSSNIVKGAEVVGIQQSAGSVSMHVRQNNSEYSFDTGILINASGLNAVRIADMAGSNEGFEQEYIKGEFLRFYGDGIRANIYQAPRKVILPGGSNFTEYGVHATPVTPGRNEFLLGPLFKATSAAYDLKSSCTEEEIVSHAGFLEEAENKKYYQGHVGILGLVKGHEDFIIYRKGNIINLLGMESPALSSSLAIGKYVASML